MADPSMFDPLRIPAATLIALDWRPFHFAIQPYHHLIRALHLIAMAAFFGAIAWLDLHLLGWPGWLPLRTLIRLMRPWLCGTLAVAAFSGAALFLYDPVRVGSHAYWAPKLLAIALALLNAALLHRAGLAAGQPRPTAHLRLAGAISLVCWTAAMLFAGLDVEGPPKVLLL